MTDRCAVGILAHRDPAHLRALVDSLDHPSIDIYLHVDAKVPVEPFLRALPGERRVTYVPRRHTVTWGGCRMVGAILEVIGAAHRRGGYHRYALLSGSDVRIAPLDRVLDQRSGDNEFLRIERRLSPTVDVERYRRVSHRHFPDSHRLVDRYLSGRLPRRVDTTIDLHQGSTWWALTATAISEILRFVDHHPRWMVFHRHTYCPDEVVFHSILAASTVADRITADLSDADDARRRADPIHGMHYIDWSDPTAAHPRDLCVDDLDRLLDSPALFARKVGPGSDTLVRALSYRLPC